MLPYIYIYIYKYIHVYLHIHIHFFRLSLQILHGGSLAFSLICKEIAEGISMQRNKAVLCKGKIFETEYMFSIDSYIHVSIRFQTYPKMFLSHKILKCEEQQAVYYSLYFGHEDVGLINSISWVVCMSKVYITFRGSL